MVVIFTLGRQENSIPNPLFPLNKVESILQPLINRITECEKRAYLDKFLVPIQIPEEFLVDNEIKTYQDQCQDLQAEFQVNHQQLEASQKESINPAEQKKEITQLEQEKDQFVSRIPIFKNKNTNKQYFQALLEVTNLLRKEQEEEARLQDKLLQQRQQLEWTDQQLLGQQQRLLDAKRSLSPDNTPEQMLQSMRNEVKKNRELSKNILGLKLNQKRKKLDQTDLLETTKLLKREQEEEARLQDKHRQYQWKQQLEFTDQQLLGQQRLLNANKSLSPDNTTEQLLSAMGNEGQKNRELSNNRLGLVLNEKSTKLDQAGSQFTNLFFQIKR